MVDNLVRNAPVILENVEIGGAAGESDLFGDGLRDVMELASKGKVFRKKK